MTIMIAARLNSRSAAHSSDSHFEAVFNHERGTVDREQQQAHMGGEWSGRGPIAPPPMQPHASSIRSMGLAAPRGAWIHHLLTLHHHRCCATSPGLDSAVLQHHSLALLPPLASMKPCPLNASVLFLVRFRHRASRAATVPFWFCGAPALRPQTRGDATSRQQPASAARRRWRLDPRHLYNDHFVFGRTLPSFYFFKKKNLMWDLYWM